MYKKYFKGASLRPLAQKRCFSTPTRLRPHGVPRVAGLGGLQRLVGGGGSAPCLSAALLEGKDLRGAPIMALWTIVTIVAIYCIYHIVTMITINIYCNDYNMINRDYIFVCDSIPPFNPGIFGGGGKARNFWEIFHLTTWNIPPPRIFLGF